VKHNSDQEIFDSSMKVTGELDRLFPISELYLFNALRILLKISPSAARAICYALDAWRDHAVDYQSSRPADGGA